jgi:hypothetical protein
MDYLGGELCSFESYFSNDEESALGMVNTMIK